jgi:hypothetical protein
VAAELFPDDDGRLPAFQDATLRRLRDDMSTLVFSGKMLTLAHEYRSLPSWTRHRRFE